ncbi:MAG: 2-isopropylmalate synthase [SAR324 cluster bacterium]|nr:2-isopropylmalate synthase [SAR324 cluster bacterium]
MKTMLTESYQSYPKVNLPNRQWPSKEITKAPIWCSVDLRDGNQALVNPMNLGKKMELFNLLVEMGFKEIEVGFPSAADVEFKFVRKLIEENLIPEDVTIQVLSQTRDHLIEKTYEAIEGAKRAVVHIYNSTSAAQRRVVFNADRAGITAIAVRGAELSLACANALSDTEVVFQYSPESFTGTELDYALEISEAVLDVWQPTPEKKAIINLPSTVEMSTPNVFADRIEWFCQNLKNRESVIISVHTHNDRGTGVATGELAVLAGADRVEGTLFGNGERTGNMDIVTMALNLFSEGVDPQLDCHDIQKLIDVYERCTEMPVPARHPYAGELVYTAFSGSHQDAIRKGMLALQKPESQFWDVPYLPINPQHVGRTYEAIIRINSQSGKGGVAYVMEQEFGYQLPKKMHPEFAQVVQKISEQTGEEVPTSRIYQSFQEEYLWPKTPFEVKSCRIESESVSEEDSTIKTTVRAKVKIYENLLEIVGEGNGPIDAFCEGIRKSEDTRFQFVSYHEHALGEGSNAQAVAYVQIEVGNLFFFGVGMDSNISLASIKALCSALNRAYKEVQ